MIFVYIENKSLAYLGIRASFVPFLLPKPRCLPIRLASVRERARARECIVTGLRMMRPSATSLRIVWRELAFEISPTSFGSSQILRFPQPTTDAARRFCVRRLTLCEIGCQHLLCGDGRVRSHCALSHRESASTSGEAGNDGICGEADWYSMSFSLHFGCLVVGFVGCLTRGNWTL